MNGPSVTPSLGHDVIVIGSSCSWRCERMICRRNRISASTEIRLEGLPEKGRPGVDSSMYRPYSGWKVGIAGLQRDQLGD